VSTNGAEQRNSLEDESYRELRLLEAVGRTPEVSQRHLAHELGIALGVANRLVQNLGKKGYIRVTQAGWKRWVYALTPAGITRKVHLTLAYVERFMDHYRRVRALVREEIGAQVANDKSRVAIYGTTELAELLYLALRDRGITNIDFFDVTVEAQHAASLRFLGMPVHGLETMAPEQYVKVMVAFPGNVESRCRELRTVGVSSSQILTLFHKSGKGSK
jgi:ribosomal protein S25